MSIHSRKIVLIPIHFVESEIAGNPANGAIAFFSHSTGNYDQHNKKTRIMSPYFFLALYSIFFRYIFFISYRDTQPAKPCVRSAVRGPQEQGFIGRWPRENCMSQNFIQSGMLRKDYTIPGFVFSNKWPKLWRCEDCGSKIVLQNIMGTMHVHCNCQTAQTVKVGRIKPDSDDMGALDFRRYGPKKFPRLKVNDGIVSDGGF